MVALVHQRYPARRAAQPAHRRDAAEAAADHDDMRQAHPVHRHPAAPQPAAEQPVNRERPGAMQHQHSQHQGPGQPRIARTGDLPKRDEHQQPERDKPGRGAGSEQRGGSQRSKRCQARDHRRHLRQPGQRARPHGVCQAERRECHASRRQRQPKPKPGLIGRPSPAQQPPVELPGQGCARQGAAVRPTPHGAIQRQGAGTQQHDPHQQCRPETGARPVRLPSA